MLFEDLNSTNASANSQAENNTATNSNTQCFELKINPAQLAEIQKRFIKINDLRLDRVSENLASSQKIFMDLLPLLFQLNHPELPGYSKHDVPTGVYGFKIDRQHIRSARALTNSFNLPAKHSTDQDIRSIFLMGSCGSLGHTEHSDIDIWIVPKAGLDFAQRKALEKKCANISTWALSLPLEVHFFVMDDTAFREQKRADMNQEDCGTTQHFLLLDEFYRTNILVAGCQPLWWSIPAEGEQDYAQYAATLLEKQLLNDNYCIDFGSTHSIPTSEFISAGIWHLYKALGSPYKALMKLLLIETYAAEYPNSNSLCNQLKSSVHQGDYNIDELDPYLLVYRRIEKYLLSRSETDRLELLRRCFYYKVGIKLSQSPNHTPAEQKPNQTVNSKQWKQRLMAELIAEWGWQPTLLAWLDHKQNWPYKNIRAEQHKLTRELVNSYRLLCMLVKNQDQSQSQSTHRNASKELTLLGRQLYAAFEQKPHKISQTHCTVVESVTQSSIEFRLEKSDTAKSLWCADIALPKEGHKTSAEQQPTHNETIKKSHHIIELLAWCIANGLTDKHTRINIKEGSHHLNETDLRQLFKLVKQQVIKADAYNDYNYLKQQFAKPANITQCTFIINCGLDPRLTNQCNSNIGKHADPLAYGELKQNLVQSISLLATNNWNEVYCQHFTGKDAVDNCLHEYFSLYCAANDTDKPGRSFYSANASAANAVASRLAHLFDDIQACYFSDNAAPSSQPLAKRYIYQIADAYHVLSWQQQKAHIQQYNNKQLLLASFNNQHSYGKAVVDQLALQRHPLSAIQRKLDASNTQASAGHFRGVRPSNKVCVFYEVVGNIAQTYLIDQNQALGYAEIPYESTRAFILPMTRFIEQSTLRRISSANNSALASSNFLTEQDQDFDTSSELSEQFNTEAFSFSDNDSQLPDIEFYALKQTNTGNATNYNTTLVPTESNISANYMAIKAVGVTNSANKISWSIYCNEQSFDQAVLGQQIFQQVAQSILQHRQSGLQRYRCYITDIELTTSILNSNHTEQNSSNLIQDFYFKNQLESAINDAFLSLPNS